METARELKRDHFGRIVLLQRAAPDGAAGGATRCIRRDLRGVAFGLRTLSRWLASREARALERLQGVAGIPLLLRRGRDVIERSYIEGRSMQLAMPREIVFYRDAHRLLRQLRHRGVVHNDLAKEPNWLVTPDGLPALVDFQLAGFGRPRGRLFRLLAREDLRHLLKHKRTYLPERLTPVERRLLQRKSWIARTWRASGKRVYRWVTRDLLHWQDNEGERGVRQDSVSRND